MKPQTFKIVIISLAVIFVFVFIPKQKLKNTFGLSGIGKTPEKKPQTNPAQREIKVEYQKSNSTLKVPYKNIKETVDHIFTNYPDIKKIIIHNE